MSFYDVLLAQDLNGNGGGSTVTVDTQMSDTSTNPVQNKVIKEYVDNNVGFVLKTCYITVDDSDPNNITFSTDMTAREITESFPTVNEGWGGKIKRVFFSEDYCGLMISDIFFYDDYSGMEGYVRGFYTGNRNNLTVYDFEFQEIISDLDQPLTGTVYIQYISYNNQ